MRAFTVICEDAGLAPVTLTRDLTSPLRVEVSRCGYQRIDDAANILGAQLCRTTGGLGAERCVRAATGHRFRVRHPQYMPNDAHYERIYPAKLRQKRKCP